MIKALYTYIGPVDQGFTVDRQYPVFELRSGGLMVISDKGVISGVGTDWWRLDSFVVDGEVIYTYEAPPHDVTDAELHAEIERLRVVEHEALEALAEAQRQHEADLAEIERLRALSGTTIPTGRGF